MTTDLCETLLRACDELQSPPPRLDFRDIIVDEIAKKTSTWLAWEMGERKLGKPDPRHVESIAAIAREACRENIERIESGEAKLGR